MYVHDIFMTENNKAIFSSFYKYVLICLGLAGKKSQGPSFLQPRVIIFHHT